MRGSRALVVPLRLLERLGKRGAHVRAGTLATCKLGPIRGGKDKTGKQHLNEPEPRRP